MIFFVLVCLIIFKLILDRLLTIPSILFLKINILLYNYNGVVDSTALIVSEEE